jgi:hypothetical protein
MTMGEKGLQRNKSQVELQRLSLRDIQNIIGEVGTKEPKEGFEMVLSSVVFPSGIMDGGEKIIKLLIHST